MTETTPDRGPAVWTSIRSFGLFVARGGRALLFGICAILIVAGVIGGYVFGRQVTYNELLATRDQVDQLRSENQSLNRKIVDQDTRLSTMQTNLKNAQDALNAILPSKNTYHLDPNQSVIVADGRLTVGLIGAPSNDGVNIDINGKVQPAVAGQVINVSPDPSTNCQVAIQSFDFFKAVVTASCASAKAQ